jgi:hypothetical protein
MNGPLLAACRSPITIIKSLWQLTPEQGRTLVLLTLIVGAVAAFAVDRCVRAVDRLAGRRTEVYFGTPAAIGNRESGIDAADSIRDSPFPMPDSQFPRPDSRLRHPQ